MCSRSVLSTKNFSNLPDLIVRPFQTSKQTKTMENVCSPTINTHTRKEKEIKSWCLVKKKKITCKSAMRIFIFF